MNVARLSAADCSIEEFVELVEAVEFEVGRFIVPRSETIEACGNDRFCRCIVKLVTGDLFEQKPVERLVGVQ